VFLCKPVKQALILFTPYSPQVDLLIRSAVLLIKISPGRLNFIPAFKIITYEKFYTPTGHYCCSGLMRPVCHYATGGKPQLQKYKGIKIIQQHIPAYPPLRLWRRGKFIVVIALTFYCGRFNIFKLLMQVTVL